MMYFVAAVALTAIVVVAVAYVITGDISPLFDGPGATYSILLLGLLLSAFAVARPGFRTVFKALLLWGGIGLIAVIGYTYRGDLQVVASRVSGELVPGSAIVLEDSVELTRRDDGHFHAHFDLGETRAEFIVDSGASLVVLTHEAARRAGIDVDRLNYLQPVQTANGQTSVARVWLDEMTIGSITKRNVEAAVARPGDLNVNLLGLTYLNQLSEWGVQNNRFIMRP